MPLRFSSRNRDRRTRDREYVSLQIVPASNWRDRALGAYFKKSQVRIEGANKVYTRDAQEGRKISFHFCPNCGSSVFWDADLRPGHYGIAVGAFADPDFPQPTYSVWEESKHAWVRLPDGMQHFQKARV
jgi:hypothetical protein